MIKYLFFVITLLIVFVAFIALRDFFLINQSIDVSIKAAAVFAGMLSGWISLLAWIENIQQNRITNDWKMTMELQCLLDGLLIKADKDLHTLLTNSDAGNDEMIKLANSLFRIASLIKILKKSRNSDIDAFCHSIISKVSAVSYKYKKDYSDKCSDNDWIKHINPRASNTIFLFLMEHYDKAYHFYRLANEPNKLNWFYHRCRAKKFVLPLSGEIDEKYIYSV